MKYVFSFVLAAAALTCQAQKLPSDSTALGTTKTDKDPRIEAFGKKLAEYNDMLAGSVRSGHGYRLMVLNTSDRTLAMQVRSQLLQQYPDQKVYMSFQSPYIKLKFGNFVERPDAEKIRKQLADQKLVPGNIYIVPETIEIKPEKPAKDE